MPDTSARSKLSESARMDFPSVVNFRRSATRVRRTAADRITVSWIALIVRSKGCHAWVVETSRARSSPVHWNWMR